MTVKELVAALREADPSGELDVIIHEGCAVTDADFIAPLNYSAGLHREPRVRLITDCYCGYS